jgi:ribosomal protein S18 acetylase RimI-like enzyme
MTESELYYFCKPTDVRPVGVPVEFLTVQEFLADEPACQSVWELIASQFRTRSKFLAIWQGVRYVACHRDPDGNLDGFLLVTTPVNWQIDYVVVKPEARGQGIAGALVRTAINQAYLHKVPYVMLTSKESLRPLYESCGFEVIRSHVPA